ncbi:chorismate-binding protein [Limisalsivibrio acetivorans]|uniref:chorismate-binding protein n=1 Tax=Limisalsivibrio acetivorans TaxID=1304888 RepID=UPI0003B75FAA|nr:chorismate-binding protein [Limisalsivibrio acetivorans]
MNTFSEEYLKVLRSAEKNGADLFLSAEPYNEGWGNWILDDIEDELTITEKISVDEIKDFAFQGFTAGWLSYDYGMILRGINRTKKPELPLGVLRRYRNRLMVSGAKFTGSKLPRLVCSRIDAGTSETEYISITNNIIDHISNGDIYQLNHAVRFNAHPELTASFIDLFMSKPSPYGARFNMGNHDLFSLSPELFLEVEDGRVVSKPIKGTLKASLPGFSESHELTDSVKESAELSMIVDMVRNDISEHCQNGSVKVKDHKSVFRINDLLQMYSTVTGVLDDNSDVVDLLLTAFPGASITGCPKKRAMELIDLYEPFSRGIYCGSFFLIPDRKNLISSIAIRTGCWNKSSDIFSYYAGSGIVMDSNAENEYAETMAKGNTFREFFHEDL